MTDLRREGTGLKEEKSIRSIKFKFKGGKIQNAKEKEVKEINNILLLQVFSYGKSNALIMENPMFLKADHQ